jgi:anti-sigma B factor antagonist
MDSKETTTYTNDPRPGLPPISTDMAEEVSMETTMESKVAVVAFKSPSITDVEAIGAAADRIRSFVEAKKPHRLVFDFENVKFFSSEVLGLLLDIRARLESYNGKVVLSAINPQLHRVFRITNLDTVFGFFPDKDSAVRAEKPD